MRLDNQTSTHIGTVAPPSNEPHINKRSQLLRHHLIRDRDR